MSMIGLRQILGVGAALAAGWLCKESYQGNVYKWQERFDSHENDLMYDYTKFGWAHYSGNPTMDHWSQKLKGIRLFGIFGSKADMFMMKCYVEGFINDVILKNLAVIAVGVGGLYAAFGTNLHRPFQAVYNYLTGPGGAGILGTIGNGIAQGIRAAGLGILRGAEWGLTQLVNRGGWGTTALLGVLGLGLYRFWRVDTHQEQHEYDYFRDITSINHPH